MQKEPFSHFELYHLSRVGNQHQQESGWEYGLVSRLGTGRRAGCQAAAVWRGAKMESQIQAGQEGQAVGDLGSQKAPAQDSATF